jgi:hypothetical protein
MQDGLIISDDIPSGTYEVSAWWAAGSVTHSLLTST